MPRTISPTELVSLIGDPRCPRLVDVRRRAAFEADPRRIAGAVWRPHDDIASWIDEARAGPVIVYCVHGHNVSALAAARLREAGVDAAVLEGGIEAFAAAGGLLIRQEGPGVAAGLPRPSQWVTRERPKIDRIACPWLIRRFVDPDAVFHYVPAEWVRDIAEEAGWIPYDIEGVHYSHHGDGCSFDAILAAFGLDDPRLARLAAIVRGADTDRPALAPEAAGLLAMSLGLSATEPDDHRQLEKGLAFYDALWGWLRYAAGEKHQWTKAA